MYKNYIFDLYGTLVDINTDEDSILLWEKLSLFYAFNGAYIKKEDLKSLYTMLVKKELSLVQNTKYPDIKLEEIFIKIYSYKGVMASCELGAQTACIFRILSIKYIKLYDGVIEFLNLLKSKNKKIYLLTNAQKVFTEKEIILLDIYNYFDGIHYSSDFGACKPDYNFYNNLIETYNLDINESIMIGNDYICDIKGAQEIGLDTLYFHSNLSPEHPKDFKAIYKILDGNFKKIIKLILQ